jgi:hypothetical protein
LQSVFSVRCAAYFSLGFFYHCFESDEENYFPTPFIYFYSLFFSIKCRFKKEKLSIHFIFPSVISRDAVTLPFTLAPPGGGLDDARKSSLVRQEGWRRRGEEDKR